MQNTGPNPDSIYPNENIKQVCWSAEKIFDSIEILCSSDIEKIKSIK